MKFKQSNRAYLFTFLGFGIYLFLKEYFGAIKTYLDGWTGIGLLSYVITYALIGIPIFIATYLINRKQGVFDNLGLWHNPGIPLLLTFLFASPMFLGGILFFEFNSEISIQNLIAGAIVAGFVEELYFRGFLFGQLYKYTKLGFISAIAIGAILFAMAHLYQSQDAGEMAGIFGVTFMGAVLFAWLYVEWDYNLWVPIFLHTFMNLAWSIFDMDDTALGGVLPNVFRVLTITFAIVFTIYYKKSRSKKLAISRHTLLIKKS